MATYTIKATSIGVNGGPYTIKDNLGNVLGTGITRDQILAGYDVELGSSVTSVTLESTGNCTTSDNILVSNEEPIVRKTLHVDSILVAKNGVAGKNVDPFVDPNTSSAEMLADDPDLEMWNVKTEIEFVDAASRKLTFDFNGVVVNPVHPFTDGQGNQVIRTVKDYYKALKKLVAETDLSTRNAVIKLHRVTVDAGVQVNLNTYYALTIDYDYKSTDSLKVKQDVRVYDIQTVPYTISKPSTGIYNNVVNTTNYDFYDIGVKDVSTTWSVGSNIPSSGNLIEELNITIPSSWNA